MKIYDKEYGNRSSANGVTDAPTRWHSTGVSLAGIVTSVDFGTKVQEIPIFFQLLTEAEKNTLKNDLMDTIKPGNYVDVCPDNGDDLQIGVATNATASLLFTSFEATWVCPDRWDVLINFTHYSGSLA